MISAEDFLNNVKNNKAAFLAIIDQSNLFKNSHVIHMMNVISKFFTSEEFFLFREYENYTDKLSTTIRQLALTEIGGYWIFYTKA